METEECAICMDTYNEDTNKLDLSCKHNFHFKCIVNVLNAALHQHIDFKCPLCRNIEIRKETEQYKMLRDHYMNTREQTIIVEVIADNADSIDEDEDYHQWIPGWLERQQIERQQQQIVPWSNCLQYCLNMGILFATICILPLLCLLVGMIVFVVMQMSH